MDIKKIGIIGGSHGIGASFAEHFRQKFGDSKDILVSGRKTDITNKKIIQGCDLVIFSVPIAVTNKVLLENLEFSRKDQIWADFTSIKIDPVEVMLRSKAEVCGMHPMFAPKENLCGQKIIFTPDRISETNLEELRSIFKDFEIIFSTPNEHDEIMSIIQGVSHFYDFVMGVTLKNIGVDFEKILKFSSPPYRLKLEILGRMFGLNPELYSQIATLNPKTGETTQKILESFVLLKNYVDVRAYKSLAKEFLDVQKYLGKDFCREAYVKSERIMNERILEIPQKTKFCLSQKCDLAIFGDQNSHTDEASFLFSEREVARETKYFKNIFEVFDAIENGTAKAGVVPFENSTMGSVFATLDELFERPDVVIVAAKEKSINQHLLGIPGAKISEIRKIISHPQALTQSQKWIRKNLKEAAILSDLSTAVAAQKVKILDDVHVSAIGSRKIAKKLGLEILAENLQQKENKTNFVLIKKARLPKKTQFTSFVFWFSADKSGNLEEVLRTFSNQKINLTKIDSRRAPKKYGRYLFFVDAEISVDKAEKLLPVFERQVGGIRILGGWGDSEGPNSQSPLLSSSLLRTGLVSFPTSGSSPSKAFW